MRDLKHLGAAPAPLSTYVPRLWVQILLVVCGFAAGVLTTHHVAASASSAARKAVHTAQQRDCGVLVQMDIDGEIEQ